MPVANFDTIAKQVLSLFNAQAVTTAYPTSTTDIGTSKRNSGEIKEAIIQSEIEARFAICETPGNGFRATFTDHSGALTPLSGNAQTAKLPERIGPVSRVEIQVNSADTTWIPGEQAPLNEIQEMIANSGNAVFQSVAHNAVGSPLGGYFYIDEMADFITWTGNAVRVYVATIGSIDHTTPVMRTPDAYSSFLVARSIARLYKHGDNMEFIEWYSRQADQLMSYIRRGDPVLPQLEPLLRGKAA